MRNAGVEFDEVDYGKAGLTAATVREIVAKVGSVAAVLNTRHAIAKEKGWVATPPSAEVFAAAVEKDANLLRRPILFTKSGAIVGFDKPAYAKLAKK